MPGTDTPGDAELAAVTAERDQAKAAYLDAYNEMVARPSNELWEQAKQKYEEMRTERDRWQKVAEELQKSAGAWQEQYRETESQRIHLAEQLGAAVAAVRYAGVGETSPHNRLERLIFKESRSKAGSDFDARYWIYIVERLRAIVAGDAGEGWHSPEEWQALEAKLMEQQRVMLELDAGGILPLTEAGKLAAEVLAAAEAWFTARVNPSDDPEDQPDPSEFDAAVNRLCYALAAYREARGDD